MSIILEAFAQVNSLSGDKFSLFCLDFQGIIRFLGIVKGAQPLDLQSGFDDMGVKTDEIRRISFFAENTDRTQYRCFLKDFKKTAMPFF